MYKKILNEIWGDIPMKARYLIFFVIGFGLCVIFWLTSCSSVQKIVEDYPCDNAVEQIVEDVIEYKIGADIDLSFWNDGLKKE